MIDYVDDILDKINMYDSPQEFITFLDEYTSNLPDTLRKEICDVVMAFMFGISFVVEDLQ